MQPQIFYIVYMILNYKSGLTGCGLHGTVLFPFFLSGQSNIADSFFIKLFFALVEVQ